MPKPPPTSGVRIRTLSAPTLSTPASMSVHSQPPCVQACSVMPLAASHSAIAARGSIAFATSRLLMTLSFVTCAALPSAASTAPRSPNSQSKLRFAGTSSCTSGWPAAAALSVSATAGSDSYSTSTSSAASLAWASVSATTNATLSPTWRTRVGAQDRAQRVDALGAVAVLHRDRAGQRVAAAGLEVGPGDHREHPRRRLRRADIERGDPRVRLGRAHDAAMDLARQIDVVGVAPRPGDEALILDPPHRLTDTELRHVPLPRTR